MGTKERRERERLEQRQRILDAALLMIAREGFAALSMRKLAERIEYSAASIYLYFKNREEIAQALGELGFQEMLEAITVAIAGKQSAEALHALGAAYVAYGLGHREMYRLIFMGDSEYMAAAFGGQKEGSAGTRAYGLLVDLACRLQGEGYGTKMSAVELAELIWMALHGIVSLQITCVGLQLSPAERLVTLATGALLEGLESGSAEAAAVVRRETGGSTGSV